MRDFEDEQSRLISGLVLYEPTAHGSSRRGPSTYINPTLPVSNLRSAMTEVTEQLDSQRQTLQDMVDDTRRFRENATSLLDQPRPDLAPPIQEVEISTSQHSASAILNVLRARTARSSVPASALRTHVLKTALVGDDGEGVTCAICLESLNANQKVSRTPPASCPRSQTLAQSCSFFVAHKLLRCQKKPRRGMG